MPTMNQTAEKERRHAIVTGGASGLGREFCLALAGPDWHIAIVDIDRAAAAETLDLVEQAGGTAQCETCDVTSLEAWHELRERLQAGWPRLDLLINNAGMFSTGYVGKLDHDQVRRVVQLNLMSVIYGCDTMIPWLAEFPTTTSPLPYIINVASIFAYYCPPGMSLYNLTKAAVIALSETLYTELRDQGIGVVVVCPGPMPTRFPENAYFDNPALERVTAEYVRRSRLSPARVAAAALRATRRRRKLYCVMGFRERWHWRLKRFVPRLFLNRVGRKLRRDLKRQEPEKQKSPAPSN
jgi:NAD(P)-dependent dehydrogenase (short-subunit alcohol dehydrogenase family)